MRAAHRAQQQADRPLPIKDEPSTVVPRGRERSYAQSSSRDGKTPEYTTNGGQLVMTDGGKRGRSSTLTPAQVRDETPEFPFEGTVLVSDVAGNKKATRNPQETMRKHYKENRGHFRAKKKITLPISKRR